MRAPVSARGKHSPLLSYFQSSKEPGGVSCCERHDDWLVSSSRPGAWLTFGEGMRVCVGQRLALNEAKITLAHVFRRCPSRSSLISCNSLPALCCDSILQQRVACVFAPAYAWGAFFAGPSCCSGASAVAMYVFCCFHESTGNAA